MAPDFTTHQGLFDYVGKALMDQGVASLSEIARVCRYRGRNGRRCAIGHLIPDSRYRIAIESNTLAATCVVEALDPKISRSEDTLALLAQLQQAHDSHFRLHARSEFRAALWPHLREIAATFDLTDTNLPRPESYPEDMEVHHA